MMTEDAPRKKGVTAEMLVATSAVFIGVCALAVSLYETTLMREEQRASVLPIVELGRSHYTRDDSKDKWRLSLHAENVGIGPGVFGGDPSEAVVSGSSVLDEQGTAKERLGFIGTIELQPRLGEP